MCSNPKKLKRCFEKDDYQITETLPNLNQETTNEVHNRLINLGVENFNDLQLVEEKDLTKDGLLKPIHARKLVRHWKSKEKLPGKIILFTNIILAFVTYYQY